VAPQSNTPADALAAAKKKASLTVTPTKVVLVAGATQQFTAKTSNGSSVEWSATTGTIDASGLYTAPAQAGADSVVATLSGSTTHASATVTVTSSGSGGSSAGSSSGSGGTSGSGGATPVCLDNGSALEDACAGANDWGKGLSTAFGRIDGTITAMAVPTNPACNQSNSTHFVLEVEMNGAPYPLVVNVDDTDSTGPDVYFAETDAALVGVPWQEGWHTDSAEKLDYAKDLGVASTAFTAVSENKLVSDIICELAPGDDVSVYALGWGVDGAHDIHRNSGGGGADGAIVLHATTAPHYLLFRFSNQSF
jgi:hypothetical protein